jgi:hypothetical protein
MTKIALIAAAILVATGTAFAGSDNYGSDNVNQPVANQSASNVDTFHTGSITKSVKAQGDANANVPAPAGERVWGH